MPDREKVIKGLECCTFILGKRKCNECPYQKGLPDNGCYQLQDDFHALLKEQEAVKPRVSSAEQRCGNCNKVIEMDGWITCPWCGEPIDWEGWWKKNGTRNQDT